MPDYVRTFELGTAVITVISIGDLRGNWAALLNISESEWPPRFVADFQNSLRIPIQCVYIQLPQTSILVDASIYDFPADFPFAIPDYQPPLGLLARLAEMKVAPDQIDHVIITHTHFDHYSGTTEERDGQYQPSFPNARHYVGLADWERDDIQHVLQDSNSEPSRTLSVLKRNGLLDLVTGNRTIGDEITILAAPGESPGHQIVRVRSGRQTLYCLGDLYHHPVEADYPECMSPWTDSAAMRASRRALTESALAENALLIATHIPTIGRLERAESGVIWRAV